MIRSRNSRFAAFLESQAVPPATLLFPVSVRKRTCQFFASSPKAALTMKSPWISTKSPGAELGTKSKRGMIAPDSQRETGRPIAQKYFQIRLLILGPFRGDLIDLGMHRAGRHAQRRFAVSVLRWWQERWPFLVIRRPAQDIQLNFARHRRDRNLSLCFIKLLYFL